MLFRIFSVFYNRFLGFVASLKIPGLTPLIIFLFRKTYAIKERPRASHKNLSQYFLRDRLSLPETPKVLASPVDCFFLETGKPESSGLSVKGIDYRWKELPEWDDRLKNAQFWNLYLAPHHYHWFHAPCGGSNLEARRVSGKFYPVNALGRWMSSALYAENERLSFRWESPDYGQILMMCVGALGVSRIISALGEVREGSWQSLRPSLDSMDRLGAFELGSSVVLLAERAPAARPLGESLNLGDPLV